MINNKNSEKYAFVKYIKKINHDKKISKHNKNKSKQCIIQMFQHTNYHYNHHVNHFVGYRLVLVLNFNFVVEKK